MLNEYEDEKFVTRGVFAVIWNADSPSYNISSKSDDREIHQEKVQRHIWHIFRDLRYQFVYP